MFLLADRGEQLPENRMFLREHRFPKQREVMFGERPRLDHSVEIKARLIRNNICPV